MKTPSRWLSRVINDGVPLGAMSVYFQKVIPRSDGESIVKKLWDEVVNCLKMMIIVSNRMWCDCYSIIILTDH